ncbi:SnoaL-like protein [Panacagrimonas perspica]|uniref:SnoaL-like protein n=1 Tax=Panacagrimonas perspica TaxID=381431 RepID=A0A4R7PFZ4_9GAMM|nr:nuclear transport factor 2 family protein [Panacagrimonas perspica]TDU32702.1 SnoaL-like protein [Panacagrimonas perspica]
MANIRPEDELAITRTIQLVARAYDHKRHRELLPRAFEENARQHYYLLGQFVEFSMPAGVDVAMSYHERCYATQHLVSPPVIESFDGDVARTTSTVHAVHVQILKDGTRANWILGGYYHDTLVRHPEGWRIRERTAVGTYEEGRFHEDAQAFAQLPDYTRPA